MIRLADLASLRKIVSPGGQIAAGPGSAALEIPPGPAGRYRLAQLDDYHALPRKSFPWRPPAEISLRVRVSAREIPGTWGFGWWNDPFGLGFGQGGAAWRFPALPNAAWFFYGSPPNHLAFDDHRPGAGWLAAVYRSPAVPAPLLAAAAPLALAAALPPFARLLRRAASRLVRYEAARLPHDPTGWHTCTLRWTVSGVEFSVDGQPFWQTDLTPRPPLGLAAWIDNQYAAFTRRGLRWGVLPGPAARLEISLG